LTGDNIRLWLEDRDEGPSAIGFSTPAFDEARRTLERFRGVAVQSPDEMRAIDESGHEHVLRFA